MFNLTDGFEFNQSRRINVLPFRSHYIPFSIKDKIRIRNKVIDKDSSSLYTSLKGMWEFGAHKNIEEIKDINETLKDKIDVPSCVQCRGYDYYQYTNVIYPFPYDPPHVPKENPAFHYRRHFKVKNQDSQFLVFEGVDSAFYVFINGKCIGYSTISHSKSEFDITNYVNKGDNIVDVVVLKWNYNSYLEDQDKFRFTGIFRDVYLLSRKTNYIFDYKIEPINKDNEWYFEISNLSFSDFYVYLIDNHVLVKPKDKVLIKVENPVIWSSENPYLYNVLIFNKNEKILERVGLRKVEIKDGIFLINDKHIKLKGVNRHETHPINGASVTIEDTLKDLLLIKSINANAIRTSHYPDIPEFYEMCDALGIYLVDEADVETHGAATSTGGYECQPWQDFANNGLYNETILDREMSLYERDKNRTSVIIWSLGNESNWGEMFYMGSDYIHKYDKRPIHYEGLYNLVDKKDYYTKRVDICSRMYPSLESIQHDYLEDKNESRPLLICEYTHAMGNSCGDVKDYWKIINSSDRIIGAFVWEWCDHVVTNNGQYKYGSDFPEHHNDGNFCVDGLTSPTRDFKSSTLEVKAIYDADFVEPQLKFKKYDFCSEKPVKIAIFSKRDDAVIALGKDKNILKLPIKINLFRANIDNEMHDFDAINKLREAKKIIKENEVSYFDKDDTLLLEISYDFKVINDVLEIQLSYKKKEDLMLQRIGVSFALSSKNKIFTYYGFGKEETYIDKYDYVTIDEYEINVRDQKCPYIKPQEYGSRYYSSYIKLKEMIITADKPFSFSILPYSVDQLSKKKHDYELITDDKTYICLDVAHAGVGSHACGPELDKKYQVPDSGENIFYIKLR